MLEQAGFIDVQIGPAWDTFGGASGEGNARAFDVRGWAFLAHTTEPHRLRTTKGGEEPARPSVTSGEISAG
jgi:hypothetical protein